MSRYLYRNINYESTRVTVTYTLMHRKFELSARMYSFTWLFDKTPQQLMNIMNSRDVRFCEYRRVMLEWFMKNTTGVLQSDPERLILADKEDHEIQLDRDRIVKWYSSSRVVQTPSLIIHDWIHILMHYAHYMSRIEGGKCFNEFNKDLDIKCGSERSVKLLLMSYKRGALVGVDRKYSIDKFGQKHFLPVSKSIVTLVGGSSENIDNDLYDTLVREFDEETRVKSVTGKLFNTSWLRHPAHTTITFCTEYDGTTTKLSRYKPRIITWLFGVINDEGVNYLDRCCGKIQCGNGKGQDETCGLAFIPINTFVNNIIKDQPMPLFGHSLKISKPLVAMMQGLQSLRAE